jgi:hypothetical protein
LLIDAKNDGAKAAAALLQSFIRGNNIQVLNVAGPRQSEWPAGYDYVSRVLETCAAAFVPKAAA